MPIQWRPEYALGVPELDAHHLLLDGLVRVIHDALVQDELPDLRAVVERAREVAAGHFGAEEGYMLGSAYPHTERHLAEHRLFERELARFAEAIQQDGATRSLCSEVGGFLAEWVHEHQAFDVGLRPYLPPPPPGVGGG